MSVLRNDRGEHNDPLLRGGCRLLKFLDEIDYRWCRPLTIRRAVRAGKLEIVQWAAENGHEPDTIWSPIDDNSSEYFETAKWLRNRGVPWSNFSVSSGVPTRLGIA